MHHAILTVDLGFGDAGKGSVVDYLAHTNDAHTVVRYNGGAQAAHRVVVAGSPATEHVFSQFGSGSFAGAATHLTRYMLLDPIAMLAEGDHLQTLGLDPFRQMTIDERAVVITPFQRAVNRLKELARGAGQHGSCGMGIGEAMADYLAHGERVVQARDLRDARLLHEKLHFLRALNLTKIEALQPMLCADEQARSELELLLDTTTTAWMQERCHTLADQVRIVPSSHLHDLLTRNGTVIFEGAQGVLLDEWRGFHPHTTWSTTTLANAERLLAEAGYAGRVTRMGITRAYTTRHGAGPLVTEDPELTSALPDARNSNGRWQGSFRVGWLDLVLLRYALECVGQLDTLAVTCLDRLAALPTIHACRRYQHGQLLIERLAPAPTPHDLSYQERLTHTLGRCQPLLDTVPDTAALLDLIRQELGLPIGLLSYGPAADRKIADSRKLSLPVLAA